jgi:hypothetical protein
MATTAIPKLTMKLAQIQERINALYKTRDSIVHSLIAAGRKEATINGLATDAAIADLADDVEG